MSTLEDIANVREINADDAIQCCYANGWAVDGLPLCHRNPHVLICLSLFLLRCRLRPTPVLPGYRPERQAFPAVLAF